MKNTALIRHDILAALLGLAAVASANAEASTYSVDFAAGAKDCTFGNYQERTPWAVVSTNGRYEVEFTRPTPATAKDKDTSWSLTTGAFAVTPGEEFVVELGMSGHLMLATYVNPGARIEWLDEAGKPIMSVDALGKDVPLSSPLNMPMRKWDLGDSRTFDKGIVPDVARKARIFFGADWPDLNYRERIGIHKVAYYGHKRGEKWALDDIDAPELELLTPTPTSNRHAAIRFRLTDATGVDYGKLVCEINGRRLAADELRRDGEAFVYEPKAPWPAERQVSIKVDCADVNGFAATEWGFVSITTNRLRHAKWTVRDDGVLLQDGKPFFPLGITSIHAAPWCDNNLDRGIAELKSNGVNCVHTYMVRHRPNNEQSLHYDELVAAAEKYGMTFMAEPAFRRGEMKVRDALIASNTIHGLTSAGQFGWGIGDDTSRLQTPRELKRLHRQCKASDPDLLTISVDALCAAVKQAPYVPFADVLVLENYPIRKPEPQPDEMALQAQTIENGWESVKMSGCKNRAVLAMPQTFKGWSSWKRYPTEDELRCEMYLSLACRARGIIAYTSYNYNGNEGAFNNPQTKREFLGLVREIAALIPSLVLADAPEQPQVTIVSGPKHDALGAPSVRCLLKEDGLLILANAAPDGVEAEIRLPDGRTLCRTLKRFAGWAERTAKPAIEFENPLPRRHMGKRRCGTYNNLELAFPGMLSTEDARLGMFLHKLRTTIFDTRRIFFINSRPIVCCHNWIRDHVQQMKGWKHWEHRPADFLNYIIDTQREDGQFFELVKQMDDRHWQYVEKDSYRLYPEDHLSLVRLDLEADVEYLVVEGAWQYYRMTGDDAWLARVLPRLEKGINYQTSDQWRWEPSLGLCIRPYTIDTWDFTNDEFSQTNRCIRGKSLCAMHGDNTGVFQAMNQLAWFNERLGRAEPAKAWRERAAKLRENIMKHLWNGKFFVHQLPVRGAVELDGRERERLSLSDSYALNRGILSEAECESVIDAFRERGKSSGNFAEWFTVDPPYTPKFLKYEPGQYVNGAISPFTAGELAKGAFNHGREKYGWHILSRWIDKLEKDGEIYFLYNPKTGAPVSADSGPSAWGAAALMDAVEEGLAGIYDADVKYRKLAFSPRWAVTQYREGRYLTGYELSDVTIDCRWIFTEKGFRYRLVSPAKEVAAHLLVPEGKRPTKLLVNGIPSDFRIVKVGEMAYVDAVVRPISGLLDLEVLY